jgi:cytochrome b561
MALKSTPDNYGLIAKIFHWGTALLFLSAYISVYYRHWFTEEKTPENWTALQLHLSFGVSIGVFVLLRVVWKCIDSTPKAEPGTPIERKSAKAGHYILYTMMIVMPVTGYIGTGASTEFFFLFDIPKFPDTQLFTTLIDQGLGLSFEAFEKPIDFLHKEVMGAWLVWILIGGHILAALYHHYIKQDRTLRRMTRD